ncbi:MAG: hypothetical protein ACREBO_03070, partial [Novosphingobium sp.]
MTGKRSLPLLASVLLLGGCVAALAPVLAGGAMLGRDKKQPEPAAPPSPAPALAALPPGAVQARVEAPLAAPVETPATTTGNPYAAFARYAVTQTLVRPVPAERRSALVDQDSLTGAPALATCDGAPLAVVVDLDPGERAFDPADAPLPAAGLAEQLAAIRGAGLTVLWAASAPVDQAQQVYTVLRAAGLDPDRTDRLLLARNAEERKQTRRLAAARDWCVVAIA